MLDCHHADLVLDNGLFVKTVLGKSGLGGIIAIRPGTDIGVTSGDQDVWTELVVYAAPQQELLPGENYIRTPDLSFQMNAPPITNGVIAEIHEPSVNVGVLDRLGTYKRSYS